MPEKLYYKMVRKQPVESTMWVLWDGTIEELEAQLQGWVCVGYNVRPVEAGGNGC